MGNRNLHNALAFQPAVNAERKAEPAPMDERTVRIAAQAQWEARWPGRPYRAGTLLEKQVAAGLEAVSDRVASLVEVLALREQVDNYEIAGNQLLADARTWQAQAEADRAKLERSEAAALESIGQLDTELREIRDSVAELVQQWRARGAQADFLGVANVWSEAADQLTAVLAKGEPNG